MQDVLSPETCLHAMVDCPAVRAARNTTYQNLNIAVRPIANSSEDSILWTKTGEVLGPNQTKSTLSLINAITWLTSCEILKSKFRKEIPSGEKISSEIKKTMNRLSKKKKMNNYLETSIVSSLMSSNCQDPQKTKCRLESRQTTFMIPRTRG